MTWPVVTVSALVYVGTALVDEEVHDFGAAAYLINRHEGHVVTHGYDGTLESDRHDEVALAVLCLDRYRRDARAVQVIFDDNVAIHTLSDEHVLLPHTTRPPLATGSCQRRTHFAHRAEQTRS